MVLVPHPDDPEYLSAAVAKWTASRRRVSYVVASRGEAGIEGMPAEEAAVLREAPKTKPKRTWRGKSQARAPPRTFELVTTPLGGAAPNRRCP